MEFEPTVNGLEEHRLLVNKVMAVSLIGLLSTLETIYVVEYIFYNID